MPKRLLIVESPGKVKKLSKILGSEWIVRASCGHIRELSNEGEDSLGFIMDGTNVRCCYIPRSQQAKETISKLKAAAKQVQEVVLATDPDREGETIAWHLKEALGLREPKRVVYTEITESAVRAAVAKPRRLDANLVGAGLCRDCLDKLVGYKGSPLVWALNNGAKSVGRVQSATLHLICQREREILTFVPQDYWSVWVDYVEGFRAFYKGMVNSAAETTQQDNQENDDTVVKKSEKAESTRVLSEAEAERLVTEARNHPHQIIQYEGKIASRQPPPPFITSTLQQAAGSRLKFAPEKTMQVAQKLYEAGLITYMRTDSVMLSPEFCASVRKWLEQNDPQNLPNKTARHRSKKTAQEAHEAIRPTNVFRPSVELRVELSSDEFNLYVLIWKRAVASQCRAAQLRKTLVIIKSGEVLWQARGQVVEFLGYAKYWANLSKDTLLPNLEQGQTLTLENAGHEKKQTQPPPRYSEPKLVQLMERKGIGRPSTYSPTIATLKKRGYVQLTKSNLQPTNLGLEVDDFLQKALPDLLKTEFTAQMEDALDSIASGKQPWQKYLTNWNQDYFAPALVKAKTVPVAASNGKKNYPAAERKYDKSRTRCPECNNHLAKIKSSKVKKKYFLKCLSGCENVVLFWSDYNKTWQAPRSKDDQNPVAKKPPGKVTKYPCPVCKKPLEEYAYTKEGQKKTMLRCSDSKARQEKKHKEAVYFNTAKGWWSPKFGNL
ncbi:DNA topoisomerase I [Rivularia sp. PCC 7116]|uniref:type I DNA topoisomerase n=1 Tax=Rivularia sp. PCC 7116 TaxID=373994 RepID=UPI00029ED853|nr:type I DNA topoisomerase [Rivularia sp. PCC 7116]AFY53878.1 DNA topoisomerase I [Rivularia sp. PCC 7116]